MRAFAVRATVVLASLVGGCKPGPQVIKAWCGEQASRDASSYQKARTAYLAGAFDKAAGFVPTFSERKGSSEGLLVRQTDCADDALSSAVATANIQRSFLMYLYDGTIRFDFGDPQQALLLTSLKKDTGAMNKLWREMQQPGVSPATAAKDYRVWIESQLGNIFCHDGECWEHLPTLKEFLIKQAQVTAEQGD